jgi:hypothetical protein
MRHWAGIVMVSVVVHLLLLDALPRLVVEPAADEPDLVPLRARLMPAITAATPPVPVVRPIVPKIPAAPRKPKPKPVAVAPTPPKPAPVSSLAMPPTIDEPMAADPVPVPVPVPVPAPAPSVQPVQPPAEAAPATEPTPSPPPVAVTPPLSARLEYKALSQDIRQANPIYGNGTITWSTADGRYRIALDATAKALFFNLDLLSSRSDGAIGGAGLAPDRYTEQTRRRAMLAANFNRDARQSVTFSASPASVPLRAGAQDRLSILFQIGGLLLADPSRATTGSRIEVPVANVRNDVEQWTFVSFGKETIDSGVGPTATTHFQRTPKPGSNDRTLDLWVSDEGGYPAQVRYTEPNGSTVTMTLDRIGAVE